MEQQAMGVNPATQQFVAAVAKGVLQEVQIKRGNAIMDLSARVESMEHQLADADIDEIKATLTDFHERLEVPEEKPKRATKKAE